MLKDKDRRFCEDREWRNRFGGVAMIGATVLWAGVWVWFVLKVPLLADPFAVANRLRVDELEPGTEALLAAMCPILFDLVGLLVLGFLVLALLWTRMERRYLRILKELGN